MSAPPPTDPQDFADLEDRVAAILEMDAGEQAHEFALLRRRYPEHAPLLERWERAANAIPAGGETTITSPGTPRGDRPVPMPERIGPYRMLELLGQGGMGVVFLAEQTEPIRRRVALKVIRPGFDTKRVLARFELERRALAVMSHDCIAKVFDAGTTEEGQPFFVMEHVAGVPLTRYCQDHDMQLRARIELFRRVCSGVQHAHQKGVIHRDLKPGNILVVHDAEHEIPKIIDFGLARATEGELVGETRHTADGQFLGTPEYMSPEQAAHAHDTIDTRTDIYSLGVILYQLLTGELPFSSERLRSAEFHEVHRILSDEPPPRPSTQISSRTGDESWSGPASAPVLVRELRRDLDWIVLKAMAKDPTQRYATAAELSSDLQRYLANEPVLAGPPGFSYRLSKFIKRHPTSVAAALLILVVLITGSATSRSYYLLARADAVTKEEQQKLAAAEADRAEGLRTRALRERKTAEATLRRFHRLAVVVRLESARQTGAALPPPWPDAVSVYAEWLREGHALADELPAIRQTLSDLSAGLLPLTVEEQERDRRTSPEYDDYLLQEKKVAALRRAAGICNGVITPARVELPQPLPNDPRLVMQLARGRVSEDRKMFGAEAVGLALARHALRIIEDVNRPAAQVVLARALFANGMDDEARSVCAAALREVPAGRETVYLDFSRKLHAAITGAPRALEQAEAELTRLRDATSRRRTFRFADAADQFLYETLQQIEGQLAAFAAAGGMLPRVRQRWSWAQRIGGLTGQHPNCRVTWEQARQAVRRADGIEASRLYAIDPVDLRPQIGLVPIGMNPVTKLWEFYHLRSAFDPAADTDPASLVIPRHGADGTIDVSEHTGIVFALIPGGTFQMGAQRINPDLPNFDAMATPSEGPVHGVTLAPFLLARHEVTKDQWQRLSGGVDPSFYRRGAVVPPRRVDGRHPVEHVSRDASLVLMRSFGLDLPTEAQWEYACRAGTDRAWFTGGDAATLAGFANVMDEFAARVEPGLRGVPAPFDDGYLLHAPVGLFKANDFGLHDVLGNVAEWCRDPFSSYSQPRAPGDGARRPRGRPQRALCRGGGSIHGPPAARCAIRRGAAFSYVSGGVGLRAARSIRGDRR